MSVFMTAGEKQNIRDRRALRRTKRVRERETMTPEEIDRRMVATILKTADEGRAVSFDDFSRQNIPRAAIQARFKICLARAEEKNSRVRHMMSAEAM